MPYDNNFNRYHAPERLQPLTAADLEDAPDAEDTGDPEMAWPEMPPEPVRQSGMVEMRGGEIATSTDDTDQDGDADQDEDAYPGWREEVERQQAEERAERERREAPRMAMRARQRPEMPYDPPEVVEERRHYVERLWLQRTSVRDIARTLASMKRPDGSPRFNRCGISTVQRDIDWVRKNNLIAAVSHGTLAERRAESIRTHELVQHEAWMLTQKVDPRSQNASAGLQLVMTAQEKLDRIYGVGAPESLTSQAVVEIHQAAEQALALIAEQLGVPGEDVLRVFNQLLQARAGGTSVGPLLGAPDSIIEAIPELEPLETAAEATDGDEDEDNDDNDDTASSEDGDPEIGRASARGED